MSFTPRRRFISSAEPGAIWDYVCDHKHFDGEQHVLFYMGIPSGSPAQSAAQRFEASTCEFLHAKDNVPTATKAA